MPHEVDLLQTLPPFLAQTPTLSLATIDTSGSDPTSGAGGTSGGGGHPHAANLNFITDADLNFYWLSHPDSAHSRHIAAHPHVAATVYTPFREPSEIRGVQIHGSAAPLPPGDFDAIWAQFCEKFPYAAALESRARSERFYRLTPTWLRYIDNSINFGFKIETPWPPPPPPERQMK